jgi:hypothetical protein
MLPGGAGDAANLALYRTGGGSDGTASFKVDGSLIIAFLWDGELRTTTRRRMDSEQVNGVGHASRGARLWLLDSERLS